jgi:hypothetical protein
MAKKFKGDRKTKLPAQKIEPYRLWFEFLKLAHQDPSLKVNMKKYQGWGNVVGIKFNDWWDDHWRDLFGVSIGTREISSAGDFELSNDSTSMIVRLPLNQTTDQTIREVKELLKGKTKQSKGRFALSGKAQIKVLPVRQMLKVYELSLKGNDIDGIANKYYRWAKDWNNKIIEKGWERTKISIPNAIGVFNDPKKTGYSETSDHRRIVNRMLKRARQIAANVASGEFPGTY